MSRSLRIFLVIAGLAGAALLVLRPFRPAETSLPSDVPAARSGAESTSGRGSKPGPRLPFSAGQEDEPAMAGTLHGTDVAGALLVDDAGNFVPTADAVALFEYFLAATGEVSDEEIQARLRAEIARRTEPPADAQALAFLDRYMAYRDQARVLGAGQSEDGDLRERFERLRALRRQVFGEEIASRLFGEEEAAAEVAVAQREVAADPDLTDAEKAARIEELYGQLPAPLREARDQAMAAIKLREDEARLKESGAGPEEIRRLREERFGEEAADRLEDLDDEDAEWDRRLADFRRERARIASDESLTFQQQQAAISRLFTEGFSESERLRVRALDEIAGQQ